MHKECVHVKKPVKMTVILTGGGEKNKYTVVISTGFSHGRGKDQYIMYTIRVKSDQIGRSISLKWFWCK